MRKLAAAALAAAFLAGAAQADDDSDEALRAKYDAAMAVLGDHAFHEKWSAKESIRTGEEADRVLSLADDELKRIHEAVKNVRPWCQKKFLVNACIDEARKLSFEREREVRSIMNAANDVKRAERTAAYEKKRAEALAEPKREPMKVTPKTVKEPKAPPMKLEPKSVREKREPIELAPKSEREPSKPASLKPKEAEAPDAAAQADREALEAEN